MSGKLNSILCVCVVLLLLFLTKIKLRRGGVGPETMPKILNIKFGFREREFFWPTSANRVKKPQIERCLGSFDKRTNGAHGANRLS